MLVSFFPVFFSLSFSRGTLKHWSFPTRVWSRLKAFPSPREREILTRAIVCFPSCAFWRISPFDCVICSRYLYDSRSLKCRVALRFSEVKRRAFSFPCLLHGSRLPREKSLLPRGLFASSRGEKRGRGGTGGQGEKFLLLLHRSVCLDSVGHMFNEINLNSTSNYMVTGGYLLTMLPN